MKLAEQFKPGGIVELTTASGERLQIGGAGETHKLEKVDDVEHVLHLLTLIPAGRQKGKKARVLVPYSGITNVTVVL